VLLPFWNRFPSSRDDDKFRVAAHLSRIGSKNSAAEVKAYERGEVKLEMQHNRLMRALFIMAIGVMFAVASVAYYLYANKWKVTGDMAWSGPAILIALILTTRYVILFFRPGAAVALNGAKLLGRLGSDEELDSNVQAALEAGNFHGIAVHPRLVVVSTEYGKRMIHIDADFTSFFIALRLLQKWPDERFFKRVNVFHAKASEAADNRLTREIRKKMWREKDALKKLRSVKRGGMSLLKHSEPFHPLADPDELYDSVMELLGSE